MDPPLVTSSILLSLVNNSFVLEFMVTNFSKGAFILERKQKRCHFQSVALFPTCVFILEQFPSESESDVTFTS